MLGAHIQGEVLSVFRLWWKPARGSKGRAILTVEVVVGMGSDFVLRMVKQTQTE